MSVPAVSGIHHVVIYVDDLEVGTQWYLDVLGANRIKHLDHHGGDGTGPLFATILTVPGMPGSIQIRQGVLPGGYDPLTLEVTDEAALDEWMAHLDVLGISHSGVLQKRTGKAVEIPTPEGQLLRFYTAPVGGFDAIQISAGMK